MGLVDMVEYVEVCSVHLGILGGLTALIWRMYRSRHMTRERSRTVEDQEPEPDIQPSSCFLNVYLQLRLRGLPAQDVWTQNPGSHSVVVSAPPYTYIIMDSASARWPYGWGTCTGTRSSKADCRRKRLSIVSPHRMETPSPRQRTCRTSSLNGLEMANGINAQQHVVNPAAEYGQCGEGLLGWDQGNGNDHPLANLAGRGSHTGWM